MGAVLRAHDPAIGRDVAVKVILPHYRDDPDVPRRFLDEVRLAGQLQHPGRQARPSPASPPRQQGKRMSLGVAKEQGGARRAVCQ
jgi:serine/threonine protein kinase